MITGIARIFQQGAKAREAAAVVVVAVVLVVAQQKCGVKITPPVLIEDHTMHFTPVLNLWCQFNTQLCYSNTFGCYFNTLWCYVQTLGSNFNTWGCGPLLTPTGVILTSQFLHCVVVVVVVVVFCIIIVIILPRREQSKLNVYAVPQDS